MSELKDLNRAAHFLESYRKNGEGRDLEQAGRLARSALDQASSGNICQMARLLLASVLYERHSQTGDSADLDKALSLTLAGLNESTTLAIRSDMLSTAGAICCRMSEFTGGFSHLQEALRLLAEAWDLNRGSENAPVCASNYLGILLMRWEAFRDEADLLKAVEVYRAVVDKVAPGFAGHTPVLTNAGAALKELYLATGKVNLLDEAIQVLENALYSAPLDSLVRADRLSGLANALRIRWLRQRNVEDLERMYLLYEEAVRRSPSGSPSRAGHLANLATADLDRYIAYGRANDLNQAKLRADEAASECLEKSSDRLKVEEIQEYIRSIHKK